MGVILFYVLSLYAAHIVSGEIVRPHIVIVVADDIGYDDVSLHGSDQIPTPNIDTLGYQGVILENYYTDCYGTAAASALLTGKYPMKMGTQGPSIGAAEDRGVPLSERLLPSYLEELGYSTHFVGKWRLGKSRPCYLPMRRGFKTFYGCTSSVDYWTYNHIETHNGTDFFGLDLFDNMQPVQDQSGHLTHVFTKQAEHIIRQHDTSSPLYLHVAHAAAHTGGGLVNLQAPGEDVAANNHIAHSTRRLYAGLVTGLDFSIGNIIECLAEKDMLRNTLFIFLCDNGAQSVGVGRNYGSNMPLRGTKGSPWEGAVRTTAIMWHAEMIPKLWKGLFHVTDWVPTLLAAAGGDISEDDIDGKDQWGSIIRDEEPKRQHTIIAIDDVNKWGAFRDGDMKIIIGNVPNTCGYYGHELSQLIYKPPDYEQKLLSSRTFKVFAEHLNMGLDISYALEKRDLCNLRKRRSKLNATAHLTQEICVPTNEKGCLYNITADPEESHDLWNTSSEVVQHMLVGFRMRWADVVPRAPPSFDTKADPANNSFVWIPWLEDDDEWPAAIKEKPECPMIVTTDEISYFMDLNFDEMLRKLAIYLSSLSQSVAHNMGALLKH